VRFWDGNELTAADAASSLNYLRRPKIMDSVQFTAIKSIAAHGRYDLVVTLHRPDAGFKYLFTYAGEIWEKKFQDAHPASFGSPTTLTMATGPYVIKSLSPTQGAEFDANPDYWGGRPPVAHITVKFFTDEQSEAIAFRAGAIDAAWPSDRRASPPPRASGCSMCPATSSATSRSTPPSRPGTTFMSAAPSPTCSTGRRSSRPRAATPSPTTR
jgi:peptide/nickel transport system substrate-binding protein